ncbi:MAG: TM2 domain-containing protein [Dokdonia donghaensis]|jgi:TM2 domain-containing membrane protein YozV|nr:TM2 domain-containing protein [Dokdonia donghaensis]
MSTEDNKTPGDKPENDGKRMADDAKDAVNDFAEDAKETAKEFGQSAKEEWDKVTGSTESKKILAGILAIFLGAFGVHKFILGYQKEGIIMLVLSVVGIVLSCVGIGVLLVWAVGLVGLIEGIIYLTKSDEEFYNTYQAGRKPWF